MTSAALSFGEIAAFWRMARRLHAIYAELDETFEIGAPVCHDLEYPVDRSEPEVIERVRQWFDAVDSQVHVWQLRQLLQSTNLQTEENLRELVVRHLAKNQKTEIDRDKIDFLLVQYFAHCAPHGLYDQQITLEEVARVLVPVLGEGTPEFPNWVDHLESKLEKLNNSNSLEDLQNSGALVEVRELKLAQGQNYFDPGCLVAFTKFNFLARRAFFRAMHLDLHAIRNAINELQQRGFSSVDCSEAGLSDRESLEHVRHVVHQWKTPFRAPYSGGSSFLQLIQLRHVLEQALQEVKTEAAPIAPLSKEFEQILPSAPPASSLGKPSPGKPEVRAAEEARSMPPAQEEHQEFRIESAPVDSAAPLFADEVGPLPAMPVEAIPIQMECAPSSVLASAAGSSAPAPPAKEAPKPVVPKPVGPKIVAVPVPMPAGLTPMPVEQPAVDVPKPIQPVAGATPISATPISAAPISVTPVAASPISATPVSPAPVQEATPPTSNESSIPPARESEEHSFLGQCVADIAQQLMALPPKQRPGVTPITLAGCKLLIATWEAEAFTKPDTDDLAKALQRAVAARTILHVSVERQKKNEPTDLGAALEIGQQAVDEMRDQVTKAKEGNNIDAAVNLAATTKRLLALIQEGERLKG
ncbi:MAG TPA: hypothetical protein VKZ53_04445 [Candidatus Angelobacter sp.]|nr:hypothetical protein [Candidatus Angelobacter sp.]